MTDHADSDTAVQLERLRPAQLETRLREFPAVYVPCGLIEWHGQHLPVGLDALKAHGILIRAAQQAGGVVYPPVYLSESLTHELVQPLLTKLFFALKALGVRVLLAVSGHNTPGQLDMLRAALAPVLATGEVAGDACYEFPLDPRWQAELQIDPTAPPAARPPRKVKYMPDGRLFINGQETTFQRDAQCASDHAAKWETSVMMHLHPDLVDIAALGAGPLSFDMSPPTGIGGLDPREHASPAVGAGSVELSAAGLARRAKELLESLPASQRVFALPAIRAGDWWAV